MARKSRETAAYERIMYPGPEPRVPVNKLGIRDAKTLSSLEAEITTLRMEQGLPSSALELTPRGYLVIHRHLFQDIYAWAGQLRPYTTSRNEGAPFAVPENIWPWMEEQFRRLKQGNYLRALDHQSFALGLAPIANELNAAHPFIEGNGRVLRLWMQIVAEQAGFGLILDRRDAKAWNDASRDGFLNGDCRPLASLILRNLNR